MAYRGPTTEPVDSSSEAALSKAGELQKSALKIEMVDAGAKLEAKFEDRDEDERKEQCHIMRMKWKRTSRD